MLAVGIIMIVIAMIGSLGTLPPAVHYSGIRTLVAWFSGAFMVIGIAIIGAIVSG